MLIGAYTGKFLLFPRGIPLYQSLVHWIRVLLFGKELRAQHSYTFLFLRGLARDWQAIVMIKAKWLSPRIRKIWSYALYVDSFAWSVVTKPSPLQPKRAPCIMILNTLAWSRWMCVCLESMSLRIWPRFGKLRVMYFGKFSLERGYETFSPLPKGAPLSNTLAWCQWMCLLPVEESASYFPLSIQLAWGHIDNPLICMLDKLI